MTRNSAMKRLQWTIVGNPTATSEKYRKNYPFYCAEAGDLKAIKRLIRRGFDVKTVDESWGWTILGWAARYGHLKVVEYLLSLGIDGLVDYRHINTKYFKQDVYEPLATPLHVVCEMYTWDVRLRLKRMSFEKIEDLHYRIAKLLIEHGADVHDCDVTRNTPYSRALAAPYRSNRIIKLLEDHGCGATDLYKGSVEEELKSIIFEQHGSWHLIEEIIQKYSMNRPIHSSVIREILKQRNYYRRDYTGTPIEMTEYDREEHDWYDGVVKYLLGHNKKIREATHVTRTCKE